MSRFAVLPQYIYPKRLLTNFAGWVADKERGRITTRLIRNFIRDYGVDMNEAVAQGLGYDFTPADALLN